MRREIASESYYLGEGTTEMPTAKLFDLSGRVAVVDVMSSSSNGVVSLGHQSNSNGVRTDSPTGVIDFFEAGQRLGSESERIAQRKEADAQTRVPALRQQGSAGFGEVVEQGLYWLMWALVLVGLASGIFGP
jgi:hypothetical protein